LALWLALRAGHTDLLDDVERLVRARLQPSQIKDEKRPRSNGAWGVYVHPFGFGAILDVFAAVLHSLADMHQQIVTTTAAGAVSVNLHFDVETPAIKVVSKRGEKAALVVTLKHRRDLRIRVPAWASRDSVRLRIGERLMASSWDGSYLALSSKELSDQVPVTLEYDLPAHQTVEEMPVSHRKFQLQWRGDDVVSCDPKVPIYR
jgi:hypothetical protein